MDQNQINDTELQKAIDDITKGATADTTAGYKIADEIVDNLQAQAPASSVTPTMPTAPAVPTTPTTTTATPQIDTAVGPTMPTTADMATTSATTTATPPTTSPDTTTTPPAPTAGFGTVKASYGDPDILQVKEAALRELFPLMDKINISPVQKFRIYKDIVELTHDKSVIEPAYAVARKIPDEKSRAEALLFLVELIDNLGL